ncbi:MAG: hypothetical protein HW389_3004 [Bacteroidetes bacterium]|nr:hypothetical protein [Bacteroidota bacterium]
MKPRLLARTITSCFLSLIALSCADLVVDNTNNPNRDQALTRPADIESLIGSSFLNWWEGTQKDNNFPALTLSTMADAHTSSWGNWGMQDLSSEPRISFNNSPSYGYAGVCELTWYRMYRSISSVNDGLVYINKGNVITNTANTLRAKAFAKFVQGIAHGWLALFFDKAFIVDENVVIDQSTVLQFQSYTQVMNAAMTMLDSTIAICGRGTFTTPNTWINGLTHTNVQLRQLAYAYKARFRAAVARNGTERAAADWNAIMADAALGITTDFAPVSDGNLWWDATKFRGNDPGWTRADYKTIGLTDTSGRYTTWLSTAVPSRDTIQLFTRDRRITGATYAATGTDFRYSRPSPFQPARGTYHHSLYYHARYDYHVTTGTPAGAMPVFKTVELDMMRAEGLLRTGGSTATIATLINNTRVTRGQLPALTGAEPIADLWKWMRYEKMIETFATAGGLPWFDRRGWDELVSGTVLHFPVPGKELEILLQAYYTYGGGGSGSAPKRSFDDFTPFKRVTPH